jgi:XTP/dITP diphosphohydrolase
MNHKNPPSVVLATRNVGKIREFSEILGNAHLSMISQVDLEISAVEETGLSFVENAIIKARHAALHSGLPALGEDSGLEVDMLNGAPGIYSARYAACNDLSKPLDAENNRKLLRELMAATTEEERTARFQCVLVLLKHDHDPSPLIFQGTWEGCILFSPQGENGFGYDPLFYVPTHKVSAAELPPMIKNQISHRAIAIKKLIQQLYTART